MAFIKLYKEKLIQNYKYLEHLFKQNKKEWAIVSKLLCGNKDYIKLLVDLGIKEICDARISNLKVVKEIDPSINTVYIKPAEKRSIQNIIKYADASFNTEFKTIKLLSDEACRQNKTHKVIIMIELGDLREGIMGDHLIDFYAKILQLPNIKITGIGTNLNCLNGTLPSEDKLIQLCLYKQLIDTKFNCNIPWITGGTSVIIPLLFRKQVPPAVNHFRIGETLFFGNDLITGKRIDGMQEGVLKLFAEIIEITKKPKVPIGYLAENPSGEVLEIDEEDYGKTSYRAILDVGLLDVSTDFMIPEDKEISVVSASSDMLIVDLGSTNEKYKVGDLVSFDLKYMGALRLLNSRYISKQIA